MIPEKNQPYIYIRSTKEKIPVSMKEFKDYYRDIDTYRKKQQRHGRCVCPVKKRLECDMDCATCPFSRSGDMRSLDTPCAGVDDEKITYAETEADQTAQFDDAVLDKIVLGRLFQRLTEIMPQAVEIGKLRLQGLSEAEISKEIGTPRTTYSYRLKKAEEIIKKEFSEFF